jgi:Arc/MetJ-type ribon-helix-helix transcriptional regulator
MATLSISLPKQLISQLDAALSSGGFSTRSEFMRTLLRSYFSQNEIDIFVKRPLNEIKSDLIKTGKYNQKFINSVINGLKKSSVYAG